MNEPEAWNIYMSNSKCKHRARMIYDYIFTKPTYRCTYLPIISWNKWAKCEYDKCPLREKRI